MAGNSHRRTTSGKAKAAAALAVAAAVGGTALALTGTAQAASVGAAFTKASGWTAGYTGQYVITNHSGEVLGDWTLEFDLPAGTTLSSLWNGEQAVNGQHVTVKPPRWDTAGLAAGSSLTVGFVTTASGTAGDPTGCLINKAKCSAGTGSTPSPSGRPTTRPTTAPTPPGTPTPSRPTAAPTATATATATPKPTPTRPPGGGTATPAGVAPYVDTSLYPAYDLLDTAAKTGVTEFNLAFITSGGSCSPLWGGTTALDADRVASQIAALRAKGGDVRVSFGGAAGSELGLVCTSPTSLAAAYGKVVDAYGLTKVDFDIEGAALPDTASNTRRAQAIAQLQKTHPGLDVSFTLPVMPEGLTQPGVDLIANARQNGVAISAVNIMAMDYGPAYSGDMGDYAISAATATQAQIKGVLGLTDAAAWKAVAVTPMIGVNDVSSEVFKVDDATQLVNFARSKGLGWLAMWSGARDRQCPGGPKNTADPTCSSIAQEPLAFAKAFGARG
ncbi:MULTISPECIES: cellulose binding domain-containing protein [unclassified Streptomyces]|uniref:glycoside hydrolase family 18 protein n=1 Tax=unclassified Streptomyces TaxID=2593676 RepID=UPI001BE8BBFE|nr:MULTISPECIES: cellulose binding domain-containing protein [unclassified Streptomyces]MBT2408499.1 cellulose binding domain-containing protein [Streptomyces sp. ISL-21]MBT2611936.1 cellulose binding domain-containing protein [Streptomyces sp. ISL-87]